MPIDCPYCENRINLKSPKAGRYRPRCPRCERPFLLIVPETEGAPIRVRALAEETVLAGSPGPESSRSIASLEQTPIRAGKTQLAVRFTAAAPTGFVPEEPPEELFTTPRLEVRGYRIERELGRGGMGSVYLARQLSLNRHVALKVMSRRWVNDPVFVSRFTREAYAAAQLSHPNIVHIHDIGEADGARFFSMEYVAGKSLAEVVRQRGKLDPDTAVGYVLQAARGLRHAHDRGMIHRDVKPDNLILDDSGMVKVADLGLVKTPDTTKADDTLSAEPGATSGGALTGAKIALGTPAYMSPEQCRDAASVDRRADIYSLGCTLYVLVTGRPPFEGTTAVELMTKHVYEPIVPPDQLVSRVPKELSAVIQRMMAKNAADRFADMGEVVRTLEAWLGVRQAGTFSPDEGQISKLEGLANAYASTPSAVIRARMWRGFFGAVAVATVLLAFTGRSAWATGLIGMGVQSALAYFLIDGLSRGGYLFTRVRQFVFGLGWGDRAVGVAGLLLFGLLLWTSQVFWIWVGFGLIGAGLAFGLRYGLDGRVEDERSAAVDGCSRLLRRLRAQGLTEEDVRAFVAKFAGRYWEPLFEAMFGFEAKLAARLQLNRGHSAGPRERHATWREPIIQFIDRVEAGRRESRERKLLRAVEEARLLATGMTERSARMDAAAAATAMVQEAGKIRRAEAERASARTSTSPPVSVRNLVTARSANDFVFEPDPPPPRGNRVLELFLGAHVRVVLAALLLAGCGLWAYQNELLPGAEAGARAVRAVEEQNLGGLETAARIPDHATSPLVLPIDHLPTTWVDSWNVGFAGLLMLGSLFYRGNGMSVFVLLGATVAVAGHKFGVKGLEPFHDRHVALILGGVLALVGYRSATR